MPMRPPSPPCTTFGRCPLALASHFTFLGRRFSFTSLRCSRQHESFAPLQPVWPHRPKNLPQATRPAGQSLAQYRAARPGGHQAAQQQHWSPHQQRKLSRRHRPFRRGAVRAHGCTTQPLDPHVTVGAARTDPPHRHWQPQHQPVPAHPQRRAQRQRR